MGTNFYWHVAEIIEPFTITLPTGAEFEIRSAVDDTNPKVHIGKRSAAGLWCWDCDITLCIEGTSFIHNGGTWHEECPKCGAKREPINLKNNTIHVAVSICTSFSWAQIPEVVKPICQARPDDVLIRNEYGKLYTGKEFLKEMEFVRINLFSNIGIWFS